MCSYSKIDRSKIITDTVPYDRIDKTKLRFHLMKIGRILEYDEGLNIFVAIIKSGLGNKNPAIVGLMLQDKMLYIVAYAKEGLIHQGTAQKAIQKILILFD